MVDHSFVFMVVCVLDATNVEVLIFVFIRNGVAIVKIVVAHRFAHTIVRKGSAGNAVVPKFVYIIA